MLLNKPVTRFQWTQLYALTFIHTVVDMFAGVIAPVLPAIRTRFSLSLKSSLSLITICYVSCNIFQILLGHIRPHQKKPLLLTMGTIFSPAICLIVFIPAAGNSYWFLAAVMVITGFGVAVTHPEGLRALHNLKRIPSALGTAIFLNGGYLGFSAGALISAWLVQNFGLGGLCWMMIPAVASLALIYVFHLGLSIERPEKVSAAVKGYHSFWLLFAMAAPIAISATILPALLPIAFAEFGFKLVYGGLPAMALGVGAVAGSFFWASMAKRFGQFRCATIAAAMAVVPVVAYMSLIKFPWAVILLLLTGFFGGAGYTLIVSVARHSRNLSLGQRMGIIIGGVWGSAALALIAVGPVAERFGTVAVLNFAWTGYTAAALIGFVNMIYRLAHEQTVEKTIQHLKIKN